MTARRPDLHSREIADLRVAVARVEERIQAHAEAAASAQQATLIAIAELKGSIQPLRESFWKRNGGIAAISTIIAALSHLIVRAVDK